jgi:soluble lytic murein transglycosylase-like protein
MESPLLGMPCLIRLLPKAPPKAEPWSKDWGNHTAPPAPKKVGPDFEAVFKKLIGVESGGNNNAVSNKGARGLTQVMPKTGVDPGFGVAPLKNTSPEEYKRFGRDYLKAMVGEFNGDYEKALAAYNAGYGNVKKAIDKGGDSWKDYLPKRSETLPYIEEDLRYQDG